MNFYIKKPKPKPVMKMITPGRRSLGEDWQEVTIAVDDDEIKVTENKATTAPPGGRPIYVPAMGAMEMEAVDFLIAGARESQKERGRHPRQMSPAEYARWLNHQWLDFCSQKLAWFRGQSVYGPGGSTQREVPGRTKWTGAKPK